MTTDRRRRKGWNLIVAIAAIIVGLWASYWYVANQLSFAAIRHVLATTSGHGTAACAAMTSAGFPLKLDVGCSGLRFTDPNAAFSLAIGQLSATAPLYWPLHLEASLAGPLILNVSASDAPLTAAWTSASARFSAGLAGLRQASATVRSLKLDGAIALPRLALSGMTAEAAELAAAPTPTKSTEYRLALALKDIRLEAADARDLPAIEAAVQLTLLDFGGSLGLDPGRAVSRWAEKGGPMHLDRFTLSAGPATASGSGDLTLSPEGLLSGKIVVRFTGLEQLPAVLEAFQPGSRSVPYITRLLTAVTRKVETESGPARETVLNLSDGFVSVGIVPIATIPPLHF